MSGTAIAYGECQVGSTPTFGAIGGEHSMRDNRKFN